MKPMTIVVIGGVGIAALLALAFFKQTTANATAGQYTVTSGTASSTSALVNALAPSAITGISNLIGDSSSSDGDEDCC